MLTQKIKTTFRAALLASTLGVLTACSTTGTMTMNGSTQDSVINKGRDVALTVTAPEASESDIASKLRGQVATQLIGSGMFKSITDPTGEDAYYKLDIKLTKVDEVSGVSRVLLGVLAGSNKLAGVVTITNASTGQVVRSFSFEGDSASHPFSGKSNMRDAIDVAAEEIIKGLS